VSADGRTTWTILGTCTCPNGTVKGIVAHSGGTLVPALCLFAPEKNPDGWYPPFLGARLLADEEKT
jgi:hypothetical protein